MNRLSISTKLIGGFLGLLVLALGALGGVASLWFQRQESAALNQFLEVEMTGVANRLEGLVEGLALGGTEDADAVAEVVRSDLRVFLTQRLNRPVAYKTTLVIFDQSGRLLARSNLALDLRRSGRTVPRGQFRIEDFREGGTPYRVATGSFSLGPGRRGEFRIGVLLSSLDAPVGTFASVLVGLLAASLLLLGPLGWVFFRLALRPVREMALAAGRISDQNLDGRIPIPPGNDDLSRLAVTLNGLLDRLQSNHEFQERLVGDLTHQLKTPLTILRGRNELALTTRHEASELIELVEDNLSDIDGVVNLLNTLLELARLESRMERPRTVVVDLPALIHDLREELDPVWQSLDLSLEASGPPLTVTADPDALRQMLTNLYDNAWKFAPAGTKVSTRWSTEGPEVILRVENAGPPVPDDEKELIFRRFYRSSTQDPGHSGAGLGLSVVRSLATLHCGTVKAYDTVDGGAGFEVRLPSASSR